MGKLSKLQTLTDFSLGTQNGSSIKELGELKCLEGKFRIWMLQNVDDAQDALGANLEGMMDLKRLDLRWSDEAYVYIDEHVIHQLKSHVNVCCLVTVGYGGSRFPSFLINSCLVDLKLSGCHCSSLPPLDDGDSWKVYRRIRHLSYARTRSKDLNKLVGFEEVQNLCTILLISRFFVANMSDEEIGDFLRRYQRLPVLSLLHGGKVPSSIGNLKQLWYLNLSGSLE
ncbi:hypothetical protein OIU84_028593 [Salix udensis]|uniref:R13L1/DRL21-like LRR repeat region domain-containing protein n=1 Tax=Salix udensis TaxID=889485 RepID=A0AAD6KEG5_9ROSI|nr:hypothetical protein OIU84_028593 [Salix udensis]